MSSLEDFGLEVDPPRERVVIASTRSWEDAVVVVRCQRTRDPDTPVHIAPPLPDGRHLVFIEVPRKELGL